LRSRYVARTPPVEARSTGRRNNVDNAPPPSTASHRPAIHVHFPYTARNFENAPRHPPATGQQRARLKFPGVTSLHAPNRVRGASALGGCIWLQLRTMRVPQPATANSGSVPDDSIMTLDCGSIRRISQRHAVIARRVIILARLRVIRRGHSRSPLSSSIISFRSHSTLANFTNSSALLAPVGQLYRVSKNSDIFNPYSSKYCPILN